MLDLYFLEKNVNSFCENICLAVNSTIGNKFLSCCKINY